MTDRGQVVVFALIVTLTLAAVSLMVLALAANIEATNGPRSRTEPVWTSP